MESDLSRIEAAIRRGLETWKRQTKIAAGINDAMTDIMYEVRKEFPFSLAELDTILDSLIRVSAKLSSDHPLCRAEVNLDPPLGVATCRRPMPCPEHPKAE